MKSIAPFVLFAVLLSGLPLRAQAPSVLEPQVERHQGPPLWISAAAVADEEKIVNLDRIDSLALRINVEKQLRVLGDRATRMSKSGSKPAIANIPVSECTNMLASSDQSHRGGIGSTGTLADLKANSIAIFKGAIRTIEPGFDGGVPASLLSIEILEKIKGSTPHSLTYILYPIARFRIGPLHFCNAVSGFEPRPGDEILIFDFTGPVDRERILLAPRLDQLFFQSQNGTLILAPQFKSNETLGGIRSLSEVIDRLRLDAGASQEGAR